MLALAFRRESIGENFRDIANGHVTAASCNAVCRHG
jgi:hypothetical protein